MTVLPTSTVGPLRMHLAKLHLRFERQRGAGEPGVSLPTAPASKFPNYSRQRGWHYIFPACIVACAISRFAPCRYTVGHLRFSH